MDLLKLETERVLTQLSIIQAGNSDRTVAAGVNSQAEAGRRVMSSSRKPALILLFHFQFVS
jgi:hypothetical protein